MASSRKPPAKTLHEQQRETENRVFMREVDDAVRHDEMMENLRRYGLPAGIVVVLAIIGLGGFLWWHGQNNAASAVQGEELTKAIDMVGAGQLDSANTILDKLVTQKGSGTGALAGLMRGAISQEQGKTKDAASQFAAVANSPDVPQQLRDLATVREVAARFDTMPPQEVVNRLKGLAVPGNSWFGPAGEMLAAAYLQLGQKELAGPLLKAIARDKDTPETLRRRIRQLAGLIGVDTLDDVARIGPDGQLVAASGAAQSESGQNGARPGNTGQTAAGSGQ